jgi:hypothetical protein
MGLWLKCPKCEAANPLDVKACLECNASLENLPTAKRVYILGDAAPAVPKKAAPKKAAPKKAAPKAAPAAPKKKAAAETKAKATPEEMDLEVIASTEPPARRAKGPKARKKKKEARQ